MPLAMCKACQVIYMVSPEIRQYCPVCGGDPLILQETFEEAPSEEALAEGQAEADATEDMVPRALFETMRKESNAKIDRIQELEKELEDARLTLQTVSGELRSLLPECDYDTVVEEAEALREVIWGLRGELEDLREGRTPEPEEPTEPEEEPAKEPE